MIVNVMMGSMEMGLNARIMMSAKVGNIVAMQIPSVLTVSEAMIVNALRALLATAKIVMISMNALLVFITVALEQHVQI